MFESQKETGGWVKTIKTPSGALFECGPHSVRVKKNDMGSKFAISLLTELGLEKEAIFRYKEIISHCNVIKTLGVLIKLSVFRVTVI